MQVNSGDRALFELKPIVLISSTALTRRFSREYSRLFGVPPLRDITNLREMAAREGNQILHQAG